MLLCPQIGEYIYMILSWNYISVESVRMKKQKHVGLKKCSDYKCKGGTATSSFRQYRGSSRKEHPDKHSRK